jgi:hypothetical protein
MKKTKTLHYKRLPEIKVKRNDEIIITTMGYLLTIVFVAAVAYGIYNLITNL